jgi:hypothetical protein
MALTNDIARSSGNRGAPADHPITTKRKLQPQHRAPRRGVDRAMGTLERQLGEAVPHLVIAAKHGRVVPPRMLQNFSLLKLVEWYGINLAKQTLVDPRGHKVAFDLSRFPYLIKLCAVDGSKLPKPLQCVSDIQCGKCSEKDFGSFDKFRAETLSWLPLTITEPTTIRKNASANIPADEVYVRRFAMEDFKIKVLYCKRKSSGLLVPVTSFRQHHEPKGEIIWRPK